MLNKSEAIYLKKKKNEPQHELKVIFSNSSSAHGQARFLWGAKWRGDPSDFASSVRGVWAHQPLLPDRGPWRREGAQTPRSAFDRWGAWLFFKIFKSTSIYCMFICSWLRLRGSNKSLRLSRTWLRSSRSGTFRTPFIWGMARPTMVTSTGNCREGGNTAFLWDLSWIHRKKWVFCIRSNKKEFESYNYKRFKPCAEG